VIVVGGGNAGLCAALSARDRGAQRVLLLERASPPMRGGNSRHTRNIRCVHRGAADETYEPDEFRGDLLSVSGAPVNPELTECVIRKSEELPQWMSAHGASWQAPLAGTLHLGRTNRWFLGGGKALINAYYATLSRMGVEIRYDNCVEDILLDGDQFEGVVLQQNGIHEVVRGHAMVAAAGGFEANFAWLKKYWGDAADNFCIRGTPHNDGKLLKILLDKDAMPIGDEKGVHAVAVDARSPKFDGGIVTRLDAIPFGVVVNRNGKRFYDEGEEIWPKRYAKWGSLIAEQPQQMAYCIVDAKTVKRFLPPVFEPFIADSLEQLCRQLDVDRIAFLETLSTYNLATSGNRDAKSDKDGLRTQGILPPKSNWALPIDQPPFYAFPLRPGITFTYLGVAVDGATRVLNRGGRPFSNLYAAGEIMAGNILNKGYLAGFGLTIGSVFGRLAGEEAAKHARS
jgi:tricarballylate dehydrogenase